MKTVVGAACGAVGSNGGMVRTVIGPPNVSASVFARDGRLVASTAQEGLVRMRKDS